MNTYAVNYDDLENRIDPSAYHPIRLSAVKKIKSLNCDVLPLKQVATFKRDVVTETNEDTPYFGLENIESDTGIATDIEQGKEFGSAFSFSSGNILFPKLRPYLNKVHLATTEGVCSTEFHILEANKCGNYYLFAFLNSSLVVNQTSYLMTGNTLPRLQTKDVENLLIPILPEAKQKKIAESLKKAYETREQKLKQAHDLLNSIDDYVLSELGVDTTKLGINLSSSGGIYTNSQGYAAFSVQSTDLENNWDVRIYTKKYKKNTGFLSKSEYKRISLKDAVVNGEEVHRGVTPKYTPDGIPVVKTANIQANEIDLTEKSYVSEAFFDSNARGQIKKDDILISSTGMGSIGKVALFDSDEKAFADNHISIVRVNQSLIAPLFLALFLRTERGLLQIERQITGSTGQTELYPSNIERIQISLPSLKVQKKICEEVEKRQKKAKVLKNEASKVLSDAKNKVEEMILN